MKSSGKMLFGAAILAALAPFASAVPITWTLSNVKFADGGSVTGSFIFDPATQLVGTYSLVVSGGNTANFPNLTYSSATKTVDPFVNNFGGLDSISFYDIAPDNVVGGGQIRRLILEFNGLLSNSGGLYSVDAGAAASGSVECYNCSPARLLLSGGSLVGVEPALPATPSPGATTPEPGTLSMLFAGSLATLALRRKR